jgi:tetratricopeptide (TPR) repeat protein
MMLDDDYSGNSEDARELAERFERMLETDSVNYMSDEELEDIVEYYFNENQPSKALKAIEIANKLHPFETFFYLRKAQVLIMLGKLKESLDIINTALLFEPSDPELYIIKGEILDQLEDYSGAIENYKVALPLAENPSEVYLNIAFSLQSLGKNKEAIGWLKRIVAGGLDNEHILYEIAFCYELLDLDDDCIKFFENYIEDQPYSSVAWFNLGLASLRKLDFKKSLWALDYAVITDENYSTAWFTKGNCLMELERFTEALECYQKVIEIDGPEAMAYCNIGNCYEELGNMAKARSFYKLAIKEDQELAEAWLGIGMTFKEQERYHDALFYVKRALREEPENTEYMLELADLFYHLDLIEEAELLYEKITNLNPAMVEAWLDWAHTQTEKDELDNAIKLLEDIYPNNQENVQIMYRLASYYFIKGETKTGALHLQAALTKDFSEKHLFFIHAPGFETSKLVNEIIDLHSPNKN